MREVTRSRSLMRRRLVLAFAALAVLLTATGFGAYALTRDEPTHVESIGCFDSARLRANVTVIANEAQDPVEACAERWRRGHVGPGTDVPPLEACVLETGAVAVFPAADPGVCNRLGIARLSDEGRRELRRLGALHSALVRRLGDRCVGVEDAQAIARRELDARGYGGWSVATGEDGSAFTGERPCAAPVIDRPGQRVVLISTPKGAIVPPSE